MRLSDLTPGMTFQTSKGTWRCTDIGQRTAVAIRLDPQSPWADRVQQGPPYGCPEVVFDELDLHQSAYLDDEADEETAWANYHAFPWRSYPYEIVQLTMARRREMQAAEAADPHGAFPTRWLRGIRRQPAEEGGHEWSAHGAHADAQGNWHVEGFDFHAQALGTVALDAWLSWPLALDEASTADSP